MMLFTCSSADWSILSASSDICRVDEEVLEELMDVDEDTLWLTDENDCTEDLTDDETDSDTDSDTRCSISECASFCELSDTRLFIPSSSTTWPGKKAKLSKIHTKIFFGEIGSFMGVFGGQNSPINRLFWPKGFFRLFKKQQFVTNRAQILSNSYYITFSDHCFI